jgi:hypothetical protein
MNAEKPKCMLLSHHQNAGQNHDIKLANRIIENVIRVNNHSLIAEETEFGIPAASHSRAFRISKL